MAACVAVCAADMASFTAAAAPLASSAAPFAASVASRASLMSEVSPRAISLSCVAPPLLWNDSRPEKLCTVMSSSLSSESWEITSRISPTPPAAVHARISGASTLSVPASMGTFSVVSNRPFPSTNSKR